MDAIKAYIETALRIAEHQYVNTVHVKDQERLSAIIVGLKIAMDNITNDY